MNHEAPGVRGTLGKKLAHSDGDGSDRKMKTIHFYIKNHSIIKIFPPQKKHRNFNYLTEVFTKKREQWNSDEL